MWAPRDARVTEHSLLIVNIFVLFGFRKETTRTSVPIRRPEPFVPEFPEDPIFDDQPLPIYREPIDLYLLRVVSRGIFWLFAGGLLYRVLVAGFGIDHVDPLLTEEGSVPHPEIEIECLRGGPQNLCLLN